MKRTVGRGLVAGSAGVTALNAVTYIDMALRGRPGSDAPGRLVEEILKRVGLDIPGRGEEKDSRRAAVGAVAGIKTGLAVGVAAAAARQAGARVPAPIGAVLTGAAAMAASDVPLAKLGISDPHTWSAGDWTVDAAGHLAYGMAVRGVLDATEPMAGPGEKALQRASPSLLGRSLMLGAAAGSRSTLAFAGPVLAKQLGSCGTSEGKGAVWASVALGSELLMDKLPITPSRLSKQSLPARFISSAGGAIALASEEDANVVLPVLAATAGTAVGSFGGAAWRDYAQRFGWTWQAGLAEDVVAVGLAAGACWPWARRRATAQEGTIVVAESYIASGGSPS